MFMGIDSLMQNKWQMQQPTGKAFEGVFALMPFIRSKMEDRFNRDKDESTSINDETNIADILVKLHDMDARIPKERELTGNDTTMKFLHSSATLADVISAVNELIKRDLTLNKVQ